MSAFLIAAAVLTLIVLILLLQPLWRKHTAPPAGETESPSLHILREQRAALDSELAAGQIDAVAHAEGLEELARRAVAEAAMPKIRRSVWPRRRWAIATGLCVPLLATVLYLQLGNPAALDSAQRALPHPISAGEFDAMVAKLAAKVAANPDDLEGLHMLGRSYMVLERFKDADATFTKLAAKQPQNAQVLADWADAKASAAGGKLAGEPEKLIEHALQIDPENAKALALAGTVAFDRTDYKSAVSLWEKMAARVDPQSDMGQSAQAMIAEARTRAGMPVKAQPATAPAQSGTLTLRGQISLAGALKAHVDPASTLFVFARPEAGGPPLAALRFSAAELPLNFDFSQASLMTNNSSLPEKIIVGARISKSGTPTPTSGDLQGFSSPVAPNAKSIQIIISEEVGQTHTK